MPKKTEKWPQARRANDLLIGIVLIRQYNIHGVSNIVFRHLKRRKERNNGDSGDSDEHSRGRRQWQSTSRDLLNAYIKNRVAMASRIQVHLACFFLYPSLYRLSFMESVKPDKPQPRARP